MEMLRLKRVTTDELDSIRDMFLTIDVDRSGEIDKDELTKFGMYDSTNMSHNCNHNARASIGDEAYGSISTTAPTSTALEITSNAK